MERTAANSSRTSTRAAISALTGSLLVAGLLVAAPTGAHAAEQPDRPGADGQIRSWLDEANYLRTFFNTTVPQLVEDPELSRRNALHARYDSQNNSCDHSEDPSNPHYTADGASAASKSVLWCGPVYGAEAVDGWVRTPIHGEQVLNPRLTITGFSDAEQRSGMDTLTHSRSGPAITQAMTWPNGERFPLRRWWGSEIPNPLVNCPAEYRNRPDGPTGQPFFVYLPDADASSAPTEVSLATMDGRQLAFCLLKRRSLGSFPFMTAAILMPLEPLRPGTRYVGTYAAGASVARWDVTTSAAATALHLSGPSALRFGEAFLLEGVLESQEPPAGSSGTGVAGREVTLLVDGQVAATSTTDADGKFTFRPEYRKAGWTVRFAGDNGYRQSASEPFVTDYDVEPLNTTLRASASPALAVHGSTLRVSARLLRENLDYTQSVLAGEPVQLQAQQADGSWSTIATLTSDAQGLVSLTRQADRSRRYRAMFAAQPQRYTAAEAAAEAPVSLRLGTPTLQRPAPRKVIWSGSVVPGGSRNVSVQRSTGYGWTTVAGGRTDSAGRYRLAAPLIAGTATYRLAAAGTPGVLVGAYTVPRRITG